MNIDQPVSGPGAAMPGLPEFPTEPPASAVAGLAAAPGQTPPPVPGRRPSETDDLVRDAQDFAAMMEDAPKAPSPGEGEALLSVSALVSQAMASWRAPQEPEQAVAAAGPDQAQEARLENTIRTVSAIERLVEQLSVSLPSDSKPVVVLRLAEDVLAGAEVRLEIADGVLQVVFSATVPGTDPFAGLNFVELGDKLVDCAGGRDVEVTADGGETGAVETWRFPRGGSRHRRGQKESDH